MHLLVTRQGKTEMSIVDLSHWAGSAWHAQGWDENEAGVRSKTHRKKDCPSAVGLNGKSF